MRRTSTLLVCVLTVLLQVVFGCSGDATPLGSTVCIPDKLAADLNGDGTVNFSDLALLKKQFFKTGSADLNNDDIVNFADLAIMKKAFFNVSSGCSEADVFAVTPTENKVGDPVRVTGRNFNGTVEAVLHDPSLPLATFPPVDLVEVTPNIVTFAIPHFQTGTTGERHRYQLILSQNDGAGRKPAQLEMPEGFTIPLARDFYLRSADTAPHDVPVLVQLMNWTADFYQDYAGGPFWYNKWPFPYPDYGKDDSWEGPTWSELKPTFTQASNDLGTTCGRVFAPGLHVGISGLQEAVPRTTLSWAPYMIPDLGNPKIMGGMASGDMVWFRSSIEASGDIHTQEFFGKESAGKACDTNAGAVGCSLFNGVQPGIVLVHVVWRMIEDGVRVDPLFIRGKGFPDYKNMIIISSNPGLDDRPDFPIGSTVFLPPLQGGKYADDPLRPPTPNIVAHEILHFFDLIDLLFRGFATVSNAYELTRGYPLGAPGVPGSAEQDCSHIVTITLGGL